MLRVSNIKISIDEDPSIIEKLVLKKLKIKSSDLVKYYIYKELSSMLERKDKLCLYCRRTSKK